MAARGVAELLRYRQYFGYAENRKRFTARYGPHGYEPALVLVLGRGRQVYSWLSVKELYPMVRVVPYDYLTERAAACASAVQDVPSHWLGQSSGSPRTS